jgi:superfamily II DNA or RNA helicase
MSEQTSLFDLPPAAEPENPRSTYGNSTSVQTEARREDPPSLRPHQVALSAKLDEGFAAGHRCGVAVMPTASGKGTLLAARAVRDAGELPGSTVVVSHLGEINTDLADRIRAAGAPRVRHHGFGGDPDASVVVVSAQAIEAGGMFFPNCHRLYVDEGHRGGSTTYDRFIANHLEIPGCCIELYTATPARADGRCLSHATFIAQGPQPRELVALGLLAPITVVSPAEAGQTLAADPAEIYPAGRKGIVFAASLPHSLWIQQGLRGRGIQAQHVDGTQHATKRRDIFDAFRAGTTQVITCFRLLAEGVDVPDAEVCLMASRVTSTVAFLQMCGRPRRIDPRNPNKRALLIDLCGSKHLHDHPDMDRTYHLDGEGIRAATDPALSAVCCPSCLAWGPPRSECEMCGATRPGPKPPRILAKDLIEQRMSHDDTSAQRATLARYVREALARKKKDGSPVSPWSAVHRFKGTYGFEPPRSWVFDAIAGRAA